MRTSSSFALCVLQPLPEARKLKDLERENARLKKLVAEQALDKAIPEEALKGKY